MNFNSKNIYHFNTIFVSRQNNRINKLFYLDLSKWFFQVRFMQLLYVYIILLLQISVLLYYFEHSLSFDSEVWR